MKRLATLMLASLAATAFAQAVYVQPHIRSDGSIVNGHFRSAPDGNRLNNYGTQGNMNPYTGQIGTVNPYQQPAQPAHPFNPRSYSPGPSWPQQQPDTMRGRAF